MVGTTFHRSRRCRFSKGPESGVQPEDVHHGEWLSRARRKTRLDFSRVRPAQVLLYGNGGGGCDAKCKETADLRPYEVGGC